MKDGEFTRRLKRLTLMDHNVTGRVLGTLLGLSAGLFGAAFGFLIGALVDQAVKLSRERTSIVRVLENPLSPRADESLSVETAVLVLAFTVHGDLSKAACGTLLARLQQHYNPSPRRMRQLGRLADDGRGVSLHTNSADLTEFLTRRLPVEERTLVVDLLLSVATDATRVWPVSERLQVSEVVYRELRDRYRVLDSDACAVLGVSVDSPLEEVKRVYRTLASQFHPDASAGLDETQKQQSAEAYIRVQTAYQRIVRDFES